jgi:hypothetical protein
VPHIMPHRARAFPDLPRSSSHRHAVTAAIITSTMKSAEQIRPSSRRAASGAWNRLKPVREDVLETYGLPSKGETRYRQPPPSSVAGADRVGSTTSRCRTSISTASLSGT